MTKPRQIQLQSSEVYDGTIVPGSMATFEPTFNTSDIQVDLNNIRSMINEIVSSQTGDWYDALAGRDVNTLSTDLASLEARPVTCNASVLTQFAVTAAQNWQILSVAGSEAPTLGGSQSDTVQGVIVATSALSGAGFDVHELTERASTGDGNALSPLNLAVIVGTDGQPIQTSTGEDVLGLVQVQSTFTPDGGAFDDVLLGNRVKISFVIANPGRTDLIACPVSDIAGQTISYNYLFNQLLENLDPSCFTGSRGYVDQAASLDVNLTNAYANQGTTAAPLTSDITSQTDAVNQSWDVINAAGANVASLGVGAADGNVLVVLGDAAAAVDSVTRVNGTDLDINVSNAATIANGMTFEGTPSINVGVTSGLIESTVALTMESNGGSNSMITTGGGAVVLNSSANVDIDATTAVAVNTANAADASTNTVTITGGNSTAGAASGAAVVVNTGDGFGVGLGGNFVVDLGSGGVGGTAGFMAVSHADDDTERVMQLETTGTGGDLIGVFVGTSDPNTRVTGEIGSLFVDGTNAAMWINTNGATAWDQFGVAGSTLLSAAVAAQAGTAFTAGAFDTQWGFTDTQGLRLQDSAALDLLSVVGDVAGSASTVQVHSNTDVFDVDAVVNDFLNGVSIDTGAAATTVDIGVTATNTITSGGAFNIDTAPAVDASGNDFTVNGGTSSGTNDGASVIFNPGATAGAPGVAGIVHVNSPATVQSETLLRVTGLQQFDFFSGAVVPTHTADTGSVFVFDDGATGVWYLNTSAGGSGTTWTAFSTGAAETWASTLASGNVSGGTDPVLSSGDTFRGVDGAAPTAMTIRGGDASAVTVAGAVVTIDGGDGNTTGAGGSVTSTGGVGGVTGAGGANFVVGGAGGATSGNGGIATVTGGAATDGNGGGAGVTGGAGGTALGNAPGGATITGGAAGVGSGSGGGTVSMFGGAADGTGTGGAIVAVAADAAAVGGAGGGATLAAGNNTFLSNGNGGAAAVNAGSGQGATFAGGALTLSAGAATSGGLGGTVSIFGGSSDASGETIGSAGAIVNTAGNNSGTDRAGDFTATAGTNTSIGGGEGGRVIVTAGISSVAVAAPIFQLIPGSASGTGANGNVHINGVNDEGEAVFRISATGTSGDDASFFVGESDPSAAAGIAAEVGSVFARDTTGAGTTGEWYLKVGAADTAWEQFVTGTAGTTSLSAAITAEGAGNFTATNSTSWGLADTDSLDITGPAGAADTILEVNALAAGDTVNINADTVITGNDGVGGNSIQLNAGAGAAATNPGTGVRLVGGAGNTTGAGGTLSGVAGAGGATGGGGPVLWTSGDGGGTSGDSGAVTIASGTTTDGDTGTVTLNAENASGAASNGGNVVADAGDSTGSLEGGLVILRSGDSPSGDAGYVQLDMPNDDDEHIMEFIAGGANGATTQLLTGDRNPDTLVSALPGSLYMRRVTAAAGSNLFINVSNAAGEGTDWDEVVTASSRTFSQGVPSGSIAINTDISDVAPASNVTMDFGTFPTFPSTQAAMNTQTKIWFNGLLQRAGVDVVRTGTQTTAFQSPTTALVVTDVIAIEQFPA